MPTSSTQAPFTPTPHAAQVSQETHVGPSSKPAGKKLDPTRVFIPGKQLTQTSEVTQEQQRNPTAEDVPSQQLDPTRQSTPLQPVTPNGQSAARAGKQLDPTREFTPGQYHAPAHDTLPGQQPNPFWHPVTPGQSYNPTWQSAGQHFNPIWSSSVWSVPSQQYNQPWGPTQAWPSVPSWQAAAGQQYPPNLPAPNLQAPTGPLSISNRLSPIRRPIPSRRNANIGRASGGQVSSNQHGLAAQHAHAGQLNQTRSTLSNRAVYPYFPPQHLASSHP
ncbi:hypothetical protein N7470_002874 [Penicillium chermesinum]|nr:hypothetical protein N7470_002874 [Penicillium chermesinum]